jgi:DNA-binding response OmpR family regulator
MASTGGKRILVVEDEPAICEVCSRSLNTLGFDVDIANNGNMAKDRLSKGDYTLILIDMKTPIMNGRQLYHYINEKYPNLADRVIFTSGDVMGGDTQRFLEQTNRPFLPKPFSPDELKAIVRETLRRTDNA